MLIYILRVDTVRDGLTVHVHIAAYLYDNSTFFLLLEILFHEHVTCSSLDTQSGTGISTVCF